MPSIVARGGRFALAVALIVGWLGWWAPEGRADQLVQDPSFELGSPNPHWVEGGPEGAIRCPGFGPRTGSCWVACTAYPMPVPVDCWVRQEVTFPAGYAATARFWLSHDLGFQSSDSVTLRVDGQQLARLTGDNPLFLEGYAEVVVDVSDFADGASHAVVFELYTDYYSYGFNLDDVTVTVDCALPVTHFTWTPTTPGVGQTVSFTDQSTGGPTFWWWGFGDGSVSTQQHPTYAYTAAGQYVVTLTTNNGCGSDSETRILNVVNVPVAAFTWAPTNPAVGQAVSFTDQSTGNPTSWSWSFGDGATSTVQGPTHAYAAAGSYTVTLTVANAHGSDNESATVVVGAPPVAAFTWTPTAPAVGQTVTFTDQSSGGPTSWFWSFGDGATSGLRSPTHAYTAAGTYTVTLTVANLNGSDSESATVTVGAPPVASFVWSPQQPVAGEEVHFTDTSTGAPTSWLWSFGDGATSGQQHPRHTFAEAGLYTVSLTATNPFGSASSRATVTVAAGGTVVPGDETQASAPGATVGTAIGSATDRFGDRVIVWKQTLGKVGRHHPGGRRVRTLLRSRRQLEPTVPGRHHQRRAT